MFLLNIRTRRLESFLNDLEIPPYYILSHVWGEEEVSYHDVRDSAPEALAHRRGWQKIEGFCEMLLASKDWLQSHNVSRHTVKYVWVDTCCINKDSSAELSEAINSMYAWYSGSVACIAYLEDVAKRSDLRRSKWFTRGWTLQELLSPDRVHFYSARWEHIGDRFSLADKICKVTGIHSKFLDRDEIWTASVAEKMSWAAKRETTRSEDIAYCLMGLFGINMPLLYGEGGERAFIRLQEEILKESTDESIFAWDATGEVQGAGMLATHPRQFHKGASIIPLNSRRNPQAVKNGGIIMNVDCLKTSQPDLWSIILDCALEGAPNKRIVVQVLRDADCSRTPMAWTTTLRTSEPEELFFLKRRIHPHLAHDPHICEVSWDSGRFVLLEAWPGTCWVHSDRSAGLSRMERQREGLVGLSMYSLNVRRAWQFAADAGLLAKRRKRLVAALAFRSRNEFEDAFVLGIMFTRSEAKYVSTLKKLQGGISSTSPSEFCHSQHWADISGVLQSWASGTLSFDGSYSPCVETTSYRVTTQSQARKLDRRNAVVITLSHMPLDKPTSNEDEVVAGRNRTDVLGPSLPGFEPMTIVPEFEYWKPFCQQNTE